MSMEKLGRGSVLIQKDCSDRGLPKPEWKSDKGVTLIFFAPEVGTKPESQPESQLESLDKKVLQILHSGEKGKKEISALLGQKQVSGHLNLIIRQLLENKLIEQTIPDKPNSRLQKYRLTEKGVAEIEGGE